MGEQLDKLSGLNDAARDGKLSPTAQRLIGETATIDPASEDDLLAAAKQGLSKLRDECRTVKLRAAGDDAQDKLRAQRFLNDRVDKENAFRIDGLGDFASVVRFSKILGGFAHKAFDRARREGRRESRGAYRSGAPPSEHAA